MIQFQLLLDNSYQNIDRNCNPDLCFYRILRGAVKGLDPQMLLDPFEKEFYVPPTSVELRNGFCRKRKIVGKKDEPFVGIYIEIPDSP